MIRRIGLGILFIAFLFLTGCASQCSSCSSGFSGSGCGWSDCCHSSESSLINQLHCQGVQVIQIGDFVRIIMYTDNLFQTNTPNLSFCATPVLMNVDCLLKKYGDVPIQIKGYTDIVPNCCMARQLSQDEADSVLAFLWAHGIPHQQMCARGFGCQDPIASIHTVCGNAFNRRIEIWVQQAD